MRKLLVGSKKRIETFYEKKVTRFIFIAASKNKTYIRELFICSTHFVAANKREKHINTHCT